MVFRLRFWAFLGFFIGKLEGHRHDTARFFTDVNHQVLDLGLLLILFIVRRPNCLLDMIIGIVLVGLKLIVINVYVIVTHKR